MVVDLQETGWVERYTASDKSLAPAGEEVILAQLPSLTWRERPAIEASKLAVAAAGGGKALQPAATAGV